MEAENTELSGPRLPSFSSQEPASPDVEPVGAGSNDDGSSENCEESKTEITQSAEEQKNGASSADVINQD